MKKGFILITALIMFGFIYSAQAFSISPIKQTVTLEQGTGRAIKIKVRNTEKNTTKYKIEVIGVKQNEDGFPIYGVGIEEAEKWVKSEQEFVEVAPGKEVEASFVINVPKGALPGSHYIGLSAEPILTGEGKNFSGKLISLLLLEVSGDVNETLSILKWSGEKQVYWNLQNIKLNAIFKNEGSAELPINGRLRLYNWLDKKVVDEEVFLGGVILPDTQRKSEVLIPAKNNWYFPGVYRAQLDLVYGRTSQKISVQYPFWYFPPSWLIVGGIILLLGIIALFKKIINKRQQTLF